MAGSTGAAAAGSDVLSSKPGGGGIGFEGAGGARTVSDTDVDIESAPAEHCETAEMV